MLPHASQISLTWDEIKGAKSAAIIDRQGQSICKFGCRAAYACGFPVVITREMIPSNWRDNVPGPPLDERRMRLFRSRISPAWVLSLAASGLRLSQQIDLSRLRRLFCTSCSRGEIPKGRIAMKSSSLIRESRAEPRYCQHTTILAHGSLPQGNRLAKHESSS